MGCEAWPILSTTSTMPTTTATALRATRRAGVGLAVCREYVRRPCGTIHHNSANMVGHIGLGLPCPLMHLFELDAMQLQKAVPSQSESKCQGPMFPPLSIRGMPAMLWLRISPYRSRPCGHTPLRILAGRSGGHGLVLPCPPIHTSLNWM